MRCSESIALTIVGHQDSPLIQFLLIDEGAQLIAREHGYATTHGAHLGHVEALNTLNRARQREARSRLKNAINFS